MFGVSTGPCLDRSARRWASTTSRLLVLYALASSSCAIATPQKTVSNVSAPSTTPPLGGGLNGQTDYSLDYAYADAIASSGSFYLLNSDGNGLNLNSRAPTNANGYCTANDFGHYVNENAPPPGTYKLSFLCDQQPRVLVSLANATVQNARYNATSKRYTADLVVAPNNSVLVLLYRNTGGTLRDLHLYRPGIDPDKPPLFNPNFVNFLKMRHPSNLRFMDMRYTNGNMEDTWAERCTPITVQQSKRLTKTVRVEGENAKGLGSNRSVTFETGASFEYCVALCNAVGCDIWMNLPLNATDAYITNAARVIRDGSTFTIPGTTLTRTYEGLRSDLKIHLEFSNEVWNDGFLQTTINRQAAVNEVVAANGTKKPSDLNFDHRDVTLNKGNYTESVTWGDRRVARRIKQIGDIFVREFRPAGTPVTDRSAFGTKIRPVLAYQLAPFRFATQLDYLNAVYGKPENYLWAIACAPYFACGNGQGADANPNLSPSLVLDAMADDIQAQKNGTALNEIQSLATFHNLKMMGYEGGPDTFGPNNIAAKKDASLSPRMKTIVMDYLNMWYGKGGDLFNWFVLGVGSYDNQYGTWSIANNTPDPNQPKVQGYDTVRNSPRPPLAIGGIPPIQIDARRENDNAFTDDINVSSSFYRRFLGKGTEFSYLINAPKAGNYTVIVNAGNCSSSAPLAVTVNNGTTQTVTVPAGGDNQFRDAPPRNGSLKSRVEYDTPSGPARTPV